METSACAGGYGLNAFVVLKACDGGGENRGRGVVSV